MTKKQKTTIPTFHKKMLKSLIIVTTCTLITSTTGQLLDIPYVSPLISALYSIYVIDFTLKITGYENPKALTWPKLIKLLLNPAADPHNKKN